MDRVTCPRCSESYDPEGPDKPEHGRHSSGECIVALKKARVLQISVNTRQARDHTVELQKEDDHKTELALALARVAKKVGVQGLLGGQLQLGYPPREIAKRIELAIDGIKENLPHAKDEGKTHHAACWRNRGHHNCAVRKIIELLRSGDD